MLAGALVAGAFEAAHTLAWSGRIDAGCVLFSAAATLLELEALSALFVAGGARRVWSKRTVALSAIAAIAIGVAGSFLGYAMQRALGVRLVGAMSGFHPAILAQLGAFNGLVALGLWAVAVAIPFAVGEANELRAEAELAHLRATLQPHFLLNSLSTVSGLVVDDPREARNLIGALGDLLRDSLEGGDEMQTLDDEVKWLMRYAQILETRHRGSLSFRWEIAEATRRARVPRLLLQPLLENAVKHGALRRRDGGEVAITTTLGHPPRVTCIVEDNGPGPGQRAPRHGAIGIDLVERRLALNYAGAAAFRLETSGGRTRSIVEIPLERAS